jgi:putative redox protein
MSQPQTGTTAAADADAGRWVSAHVGPTGFRAELLARGHALVADEPVSLGGTDAGPTPYEILLSALGSCTAMTLRMYADRKSYPLESVTVQLRSARAHEPDCENCATEKVGISRVERRIELAGPITDEQRERLLQVADRCPVKQTLERGFKIESVP